MSSSIIPTETLKFTDVRPNLSGLLNRVFRREQRVVITKSGIPVAALVSIDDLERLNKLDAEWERGFEILDQIGAAFADQTPEEVEREVGKAVEEARARMRAERRATAGQ